MERLGIARQTFLRNATCDEPVIFECTAGSVVLFARPRPDKLVNEDCVGAIDLPGEQCVLALADGVGGAARGELASALAVEAVLKITGESVNTGSIRSSILDAFEGAHKAVSDLGVGASCTLVVVEIADNLLRTYHVGDSACLVVGQRGRQKYKTRFHSPVGYAEEAGFLNEHEAITHSERHYVSNVIGAEGMTIEVGVPFALAMHDTVVLGSDGLFDNATIKEIGDDVRTGKLTAGAEKIIQRVSERMSEPTTQTISKPDDLSFALFRPAK